jgi:hypothetical protein
MSNIPANVAAKFARYPIAAKAALEQIRRQIFTIAQQHNLGAVEETLKWGEPGYLVKGGTAIRIDWKVKTPDVVMLYVHCQTRLVETLRELYPLELAYQGNRAIVLPLTPPAAVNNPALSHCIELALTYHSRKHLPLLGAVCASGPLCD